MGLVLVLVFRSERVWVFSLVQVGESVMNLDEAVSIHTLVLYAHGVRKSVVSPPDASPHLLLRRVIDPSSCGVPQASTSI